MPARSIDWIMMMAMMMMIAVWTVAVDASYDERRLYDDLMRDYNVLERPVANHSESVKVTLKVSLQQIIDVDEKNQVVHVNAWLDYKWQDYKLVWDPPEYGNITNVRFPAGKIWKPDVLLYNSVDANFDSTYPTNMIVYSDGTVHWIPPGIFKIACKIDITWFPFDDQLCFFKFGSWTYDGYKLDLQPAAEGFDVSEYLPNGEWALPLTSVSRNVKFYDCCPEPYPDLTFFLHMRRRTLYYAFNLVLPCVLTCCCSLLGFTLPPDAGEKITLQITVLLSICFFLSIVSEMSPPTSEAVPLLGIFFSCCMIVVTASTVFTVYVLNLHYRRSETHEMGYWTRAVLLFWLPYFLRMSRPGISVTWRSLPPLLPWKRGPATQSESLLRNIKDAETCSSLLDFPNGSSSVDGQTRLVDLLSGLPNGGGGCSSSSAQRTFSSALARAPSPPNVTGDASSHATLVLLQRIHVELKTVTRRMVEADREEVQTNNWKWAAMVVDRLCLYVCSAFIIASSAVIMYSAPYLIA